MFNLGPYQLKNALFLAPMVGVSDTPFREICSEQGAGLTVAEMLTSNSKLWQIERNRLKQIRPKNIGPHVVQIAGSDPALMAEAAALNVQRGADAIDINMGCPAKKVLKKAAGSALLKDSDLVRRILLAVVASVPVPVSLKIRTGWCPDSRNGVEIASIAEDCGIHLLTVHGRTRECRFRGNAEYDTIAAIKQSVTIPVIANGDIDSPIKAAQVLQHTNADGLMIGRSAQGRPWIFKEIEHYLKTGKLLAEISLHDRHAIIVSHLQKLHGFYGDVKGVWYARKHVAAYVMELTESRKFMTQFNQLQTPEAQVESVHVYFSYLAEEDGVIAA
ncbi:MAG: tRNA dihydrouridine synthase DusB [Pseudohongiella sp.]|nr:tRNA dihydrouridine synthase DusB [Pseudohongiella sp.]